MKEENDTGTAKTSRRKGCLITFLVAVLLIVYAVWGIGEPGRRARRVHEAIRPGMNYSKVEDLLTGRHFCFFQVNTNGQWETIPRDNFNGYLAAVPGNNPASLRLQLHFMGTAPRRVSFVVDLDNNGNVTNLSNPHGWD
ncbi:MAG: hypothetical protein A2283_06640 [Lentisphaerae bacterium RIFOXYA12_FULL_48_11]|nr:MAG: hypothetical protein A2283_06640 [Lentisphaerae bacterium RIFOXYA12_FULL_48_11]